MNDLIRFIFFIVFMPFVLAISTICYLIANVILAFMTMFMFMLWLFIVFPIELTAALYSYVIYDKIDMFTTQIPGTFMFLVFDPFSEAYSEFFTEFIAPIYKGCYKFIEKMFVKHILNK